MRISINLLFLFVIIMFFQILSVAHADRLSTGVEHLVYNVDTPNVVNVIRMDKHAPNYKIKIGFPEGKRG